MTTEEIRALPRVRRLAGFIAAIAAYAELGATLRTRHKHDQAWTEDEDLQWVAATIRVEVWYTGLFPEELTELLPLVGFLGVLGCGEDPTEQYTLAALSTQHGDDVLWPKPPYGSSLQKVSLALHVSVWRESVQDGRAILEAYEHLARRRFDPVDIMAWDVDRYRFLVATRTGYILQFGLPGQSQIYQRRVNS